MKWEWSLRVTKLDFESSKTQKATFSSILWLTQELLLRAISFNRVQHKLCCRICANHPESGWLAEKFVQNLPVENWIVRKVLRHKREEHLLEGLLVLFLSPIHLLFLWKVFGIGIESTLWRKTYYGLLKLVVGERRVENTTGGKEKHCLCMLDVSFSAI